MTDPTPRWTDETRDLVDRIVREHVDKVAPDGSGNARLTCYGCDFTRTMPVDGDWGPYHRQFRAHRADAVLTALADAGLMHEPPTAGPRTWAMPERIPADVTAVTDRHGRMFHRTGYEGRYWRQGPQQYEWREADLVHAAGPLTEVLPNGD